MIRTSQGQAAWYRECDTGTAARAQRPWHNGTGTKAAAPAPAQAQTRPARAKAIGCMEHTHSSIGRLDGLIIRMDDKNVKGTSSVLQGVGL